MSDRTISEAAEPPVVNLTAQQRRAMRAFLYRYNESGYDEDTSDSAVWDCGVRPWPTMENLAKKGLVVADSWIGPEDGWLYRLTDLGREYMTAIVAVRRALTRTALPSPDSSPDVE